jgi:subtilase family serine protease
MSRACVIAGVAAFVSACSVGAQVAAADPPATHAVARPAAGHPAAGPSARANQTIQVWMAGREGAAQRFVDAVSTPGSPSYHRFLSPVAYTQRFGPRATQVRAVRSVLRRDGFSGVHASVDDDYVSATASAPGGDPASTVALRRRLGADAVAVTGLGAGARPTRAPVADADARARAKAACSAYWGQKTQTFTPAFGGLTTAAIPVCGYSARQIRAAYGLTGADTGRRKTIALIQVGGPTDQFQALTDYAKRNGLPAPGAAQYREESIGHGEDGGLHSACINGAAAEAALDSEAAYAMAPRADQLMVDGDSCLKGQSGYRQSLLDAELAPLTGNGTSAAAAVESVSYGLAGGPVSERSVPRSAVQASHAISLRAAAEGVSLLNASGDTPGIEPPSDPDRTIVGGTTLGLGAHGGRLFETGWSTAFGARKGTTGRWQNGGVEEGASGGASVLYREPAYQKGVVPAALAARGGGSAGRAIPDISADGDPASGMLMGLIVKTSSGRTFPYTPFVGGGTSQATPLVAGMVADAEQGGRADLGFLNPLLYSLSGTHAFRDVLPISPSAPPADRAIYRPGTVEIHHKFSRGFLVGLIDAQHTRGTTQVTAPGYDTMTGLGTPNGSAFIRALRARRR